MRFVARKCNRSSAVRRRRTSLRSVVRVFVVVEDALNGRNRNCRKSLRGPKACIASSLSLVEPIQTLDDGARIGLNRASRLTSSFEPSTSRQHAHQRIADQRYALDLRVVDHAAARIDFELLRRCSQRTMTAAHAAQVCRSHADKELVFPFGKTISSIGTLKCRDDYCRFLS